MGQTQKKALNVPVHGYGLTRRERANEKRKLERDWNAELDRREAERRRDEAEKAKARMLGRLAHRVPEFRASAAFALGDHATEPAVFRALMRASFDPDYDVRFEAIRAATKSGEMRAWMRLFNMYHHAKKRNDSDSYKYRLGVLLMECPEPKLFGRTRKLMAGKHFFDRGIATEYFAKIRTRESLIAVLDAIEKEGNATTRQRMMDVADSLSRAVFGEQKRRD